MFLKKSRSMYNTIKSFQKDNTLTKAQRQEQGTKKEDGTVIDHSRPYKLEITEEIDRGIPYVKREDKVFSSKRHKKQLKQEKRLLQIKKIEGSGATRKKRKLITKEWMGEKENAFS
jgi:hypothetical protein